jgi:hypothetical protein
LPDEIADVELDPSVRAELRSLGKPLADEIAAHLLAAGLLIDEDPAAALAHARYARSRAGRIGAIREAAGVAAYAAGEYAEALAELRASRRMTGDPSVLAMIADSERALGRPERALRVADDPQLAGLDRDDQIEVFLVVSGARRDLGQLDAALADVATSWRDRRSGTRAVRHRYGPALLRLRRSPGRDGTFHRGEVLVRAGRRGGRGRCDGRGAARSGDRRLERPRAYWIPGPTGSRYVSPLRTRSRAASPGACRANNSRSAASSPTAVAAISSSSSITYLLRSGDNRFTEARNYGNTIRGSGFGPFEVEGGDRPQERTRCMRSADALRGRRRAPTDCERSWQPEGSPTRISDDPDIHSWPKSAAARLTNRHSELMTTRRTQTDPRDVTEHRNEVRLIGDLTREARIRSLPDGTEVSSFVLRVRSEAGSADTIECIARSAALRSRLAARHAGDILEVSGSLRHRFWRGTAGTMSRYEVDASNLSVRRRGGAPVTGRRNGETASPTPASA